MRPLAFDWTDDPRRGRRSTPPNLNSVIGMTQLLPLGTFVVVGNSLGVIVGYPDEDDIPEEHYAVWYGQHADTDDNVPLARTVPMDYCLPITGFQTYH